MSKAAILLLLAAAAVPAVAAAPAGRPAPVRTDWARNVVATPEGGFRMGNPAAKVKLVEYGSLSCAHCAEFDAQGGPAIRETYVKSGQVSWEFRTYLLFPTDPAASLLANCQSANAFFPAVEQIYRHQEGWMGRIRAMNGDQIMALSSLPPRESAAIVARAAGLDEFFRRRGMPPVRIQSCLSDPAGLEKIVQIKRKGDELGVNGTPTFFINGAQYEGPARWTELQLALRDALRS